jgi:hypothetical protein
VNFGSSGGFLQQSLVIEATPTPTPTSSDIISAYTFYWQGSPLTGQLTLYTPDCNQPLNVDSFSVAVTTNQAASLQHAWLASTFVNNVQNNLFTGPFTTTAYNSASTQTFAQDIPFSLTCGTYIVSLGVNFGSTGGYLQQSLVIESTATLTPTATPTPTPTPVQLILPQFILTLNANCHRGPGTSYDIVTYGLKGHAYRILGVSADGLWYFVRFDPNLDCWMAGASGNPQGNLNILPVILPPTSTPAPKGGTTCNPLTGAGC